MHKEILLHVSDGTADGLEIKIDCLKEEKSRLKKGHSRPTRQHACSSTAGWEVWQNKQRVKRSNRNQGWHKPRSHRSYIDLGTLKWLKSAV